MTDGALTGLLEEERGFARLKIAEILPTGVNCGTGRCVNNCGWTIKCAYAYIRLLEKESLRPLHLTHIPISKALKSAEKMPNPVPEESSAACTYWYRHTAPTYRRTCSLSLDDFNRSIGLCLACVRSGSMDSSCSQCAHSYEDQSFRTCTVPRFVRPTAQTVPAIHDGHVPPNPLSPMLT